MIEKCYVNRKQNGTHTCPCSFVFVCLFAQRDTKGFTCFGFLFCFVFFFFFWEEKWQLFFEHSCSLNLVVLYHVIEYTITYFDRQLNNNQLRNLPLGIFSSNTHLEWPHGCSRINTWTMKCPLKHALVQENLFAK